MVMFDSKKSHFAACAAAVMVVAGVCGSTALGASGDIYDIGILPGGIEISIESINASGQVVGYTVGGDEAFFYTGGHLYGLGQLMGGSPYRGNYSAAFGINDAGKIVGSGATDPNGTDWRGFAYSGTPGVDGHFTDLGSNVFPSDINNAGQIVYNGRKINNVSQVTGTTGNGSGGHAFLSTYSSSTQTDLGTLGGATSTAKDINDVGQITGASETAGGATHAFLYTGTPGSGGHMIDLGTPTGQTNSYGNGLNIYGQVVGDSDEVSGHYTNPFLYTGTPGVDGQMLDLNTWLDTVNPTEGGFWTLYSADVINDSGLIAGVGYYTGPGAIKSDYRVAYLLDASGLLPVAAVPLPSAFWAGLGTLAALGGLSLLRKRGSAVM
jgi:probable HAF family extracellular repeat protein